MQQGPSRPVLPFSPFWLHTFISLNSPELHCWLSSHPHCIKMLGLCFRVYVRRSQGAGTDPAKDSMPRACRCGQGLPSDLPKDSLCLHLVVIDCKFVLFLGRELISCKLSEWCVWLFHTCETRKRVPLSSPGHPATKGLCPPPSAIFVHHLRWV